MKKDAYYFPHFSNARNDSKIIKLRRVLGIEGYGIYFMILEILREQTNFQFPISGIEDLSYEWHISKEKIISVIKDFDLFVINEFDFFSEKLILYLQPYLEKSIRAINAANIRWNNAKAYAKALPEQCDSNAIKGKERKGNKLKKKKEFIPPSLEDFKQYFKLNGFLENVSVRAWNGYNENNWHDSRNNPIVNWKSKCQNVWFKDENKIQQIKQYPAR